MAWVRGAIAPDLVTTLAGEVAAAVRTQRIGVGADSRMHASAAPTPVDLADPATWTEPVVRVITPVGRASHRAIRSPALVAAFDALLGPGRWADQGHIGGTVPVRLPHPDDPGDAGWHCDSGYVADDGTLRADRHSTGRALVVLVLLSDVGPDDAPTEVRLGSHADVPAVLEPYGDEGVDGMALGPLVDAASAHRPTVRLTGAAGDVALLHPFTVHRATWPHRGTRPRLVAQGGLLPA
jgi:hypothetical protein